MSGNRTVSRTVSGESSAWAIIHIFGNRILRPAALRSTLSIFKNFFLLQYKAVLLPGRYPISRADHFLDEKIPFSPDRVDTYLDFLHFFIRVQGFLMRVLGRKSALPVENFIKSLGRAYQTAAGVYSRNFSTTARPDYRARFRFLVIHAFDPHLMCIPSLHVMVVIMIYTMFRKTIRDLGREQEFAGQTEAVRLHALAITEAVLYVKQHSVNCIPAAMYAMTCFGDFFPPGEAEAFAKDIFRDATDIPEEDIKAIREHIIGLYRTFLDQSLKSSSWEKPLLDFLKTLPQV